MKEKNSKNYNRRLMNLMGIGYNFNLSITINYNFSILNEINFYLGLLFYYFK